MQVAVNCNFQVPDLEPSPPSVSLSISPAIDQVLTVELLSNDATIGSFQFTVVDEQGKCDDGFKPTFSSWIQGPYQISTAILMSCPGIPLSSLSLSTQSSPPPLISSANSNVFNGAVVAFSVNIPAESGPATLAQFDVSPQLNGQPVNLTDVAFVSIDNQVLQVQVLMAPLQEPESQPPPPPPPPLPFASPPPFPSPTIGQVSFDRKQ